MSLHLEAIEALLYLDLLITNRVAYFPLGLLRKGIITIEIPIQIWYKIISADTDKGTAMLCPY